jgi:DNA-binding MarR family transcriptional regulator
MQKMKSGNSDEKRARRTQYPPRKFAPETMKLGLLFHLSLLRVRRASDLAFVPLKLNLRHLWILHTVMGGELRTQKQISQILGLNENVMVRMLNYLQKRGFVERLPGRKDARERQIAITIKGKKLFETNNYRMIGVYNSVLQNMTTRECQDIVRILRKFVSESD